MIIIQLSGGLGNQMFQYALYKQLKALGREVKIDDVKGYEEEQKRVPALTATFGIEYDRATRQEVIDITDSKMDIFSRIRRKITGRKTLEYQEKSADFDKNVLELEDAYLVGYWQSEKYFPDESVRRELRHEFVIKPGDVLSKKESWDVYTMIKETESVSIHVRRGDYLDPGTIETHGNICTCDYYKGAIDRIIEKYPKAHFFVFTDDKEWAKTHIFADRFTNVILDEEKPDSVDMLLMSSCKHHIMANSSFSWWSMWITENGKGTIFAPDRWFNNKPMHDIYTDRMQKLG